MTVIEALTHPDAPPDSVTASSAYVSVSEAARLAGCSRSTVVRRIRSGDLTKTPDGTLQVVDVKRVLGPLCHSVSDERVTDDHVTQADAVIPLSVWRAQQETIDELLEQLRDQAESARQADRTHAEQLATMASRLDRLLPAPKPEPVSEARSLWYRLFG